MCLAEICALANVEKTRAMPGELREQAGTSRKQQSSQQNKDRVAAVLVANQFSKRNFRATRSHSVLDDREPKRLSRCPADRRRLRSYLLGGVAGFAAGFVLPLGLAAGFAGTLPGAGGATPDCVL